MRIERAMTILGALVLALGCLTVDAMAQEDAPEPTVKLAWRLKAGDTFRVKWRSTWEKTHQSHGATRREREVRSVEMTWTVEAPIIDRGKVEVEVDRATWTYDATNVKIDLRLSNGKVRQSFKPRGRTRPEYDIARRSHQARFDDMLRLIAVPHQLMVDLRRGTRMGWRAKTRYETGPLRRSLFQQIYIHPMLPEAPVKKDQRWPCKPEDLSPGPGQLLRAKCGQGNPPINPPAVFRVATLTDDKVVLVAKEGAQRQNQQGKITIYDKETAGVSVTFKNGQITAVKQEWLKSQNRTANDPMNRGLTVEKLEQSLTLKPIKQKEAD